MRWCLANNSSCIFLETGSSNMLRIIPSGPAWVHRQMRLMRDKDWNIWTFHLCTATSAWNLCVCVCACVSVFAAVFTCVCGWLWGQTNSACHTHTSPQRQMPLSLSLGRVTLKSSPKSTTAKWLYPAGRDETFNEATDGDVKTKPVTRSSSSLLDSGTMKRDLMTTWTRVSWWLSSSRVYF